MAKAPTTKTPKTEMSAGLAAFAAAASASAPATAGTVTATATVDKTKGDAPTGKTEFNPQIKSDAQLLKEDQERRAAEAAAAKQKKADDKAAADKVKADAKAKKDADKAEAAAKAKADKEAKAAERAAKKAEREAALAKATEGRNYTGSMSALAARVAQGAYVKSANGQLRSTDELATALDGVSATDVVRMGLDLLKLEENPYAALNIGQQSMNLRNRMRGAIKKQVLAIADITAYIERNSVHVVKAEDVAKARAEKAERIAKAKAEKEAKAAAKAPKADTAPATSTEAGKTEQVFDAAA
jgi:hypothetical protein